MNKLLKLLLALTISIVSLSANATTYSNTATSSIGPLGAITSNIGEVFSTDGGTLSDLTFFSGPSANMPVQLIIANWDGFKAVGPALFISPLEETLYGGGAISFTGINTILTGGNSYIAYLTNGSNGYTAPILTSNTNGGLVGYLAYSNSGPLDPLTLNNPWSLTTSPNSYLNFTATIAAVPELNTNLMLLMGLGLFGFIARRKAL